jgi:hypothetical protein
MSCLGCEASRRVILGNLLVPISVLKWVLLPAFQKCLLCPYHRGEEGVIVTNERNFSKLWKFFPFLTCALMLLAMYLAKQSHGPIGTESVI